MADAADSKSAEVNPHVGSSPTSGTTSSDPFSTMKTMRPLYAVLVSLFVSLTAFAAVDDEARVPAGDAARRLGRAAILHPSEPLTDSDRAELAEKGVVVKHALAGGRYLARVRDDARFEGDDRVVQLEPLTASKKIH